MKILSEQEFLKLSTAEQKKLADESEQMVKRMKELRRPMNRAERRADEKRQRKLKKQKGNSSV